VIEIAAARMTECRVSTDGLAVRLAFVDAAGYPGAIALTIDCLSALLMIRPTLATAVLRTQYQDPSLRIVYPLGQFRLEAVDGEPVSILTLATPDGYQVSVSLRPETTTALHAATDSDDEWPAPLQ
jgi:hypothetical protein